MREQKSHCELVEEITRLEGVISRLKEQLAGLPYPSRRYALLESRRAAAQTLLVAAKRALERQDREKAALAEPQPT